MNLANYEPFRGTYRAFSFLPGQYNSYNLEGWDLLDFEAKDSFHLHYSAQKPVKAGFEIALDGVVQDYTLKLKVDTPYKHCIIYGKCNHPRILSIRRKSSRSKIPIFILAVDGTHPNELPVS